MSKGFALTLSVIILIFFLTLILTVEAQRIAVDEETRSLHARLTAATALFSDIDSPALDYSFERLAKRSLYDIDAEVLNSSKYAVKDIAGDGGLLCENFTGKFKAYLDSLAMRAADSGLTLTYSEIECDSKLTGPFKANLSVSTVITVESADIYANKSLERELEFSIEGLPDPVITLEAEKEYEDERIYRPVIEYGIQYYDTEDNEYLLKPDEEGSAQYANGWVYGKVVVSETALELDPTEWGGYILFIEADELGDWDTNNLTAFKGVVLAGSSEETVYLEIPGAEQPGKNSDGTYCDFYMNEQVWGEDAPCINCGLYVHGTRNSTTADGCEFDSEQFQTDWPDVLYNEDDGNYYWYQPLDPNDPDNVQGGSNIELLTVPFAKIEGSLSDGQKVLINSPSDDVPTHHKAGVYDIEQIRGAVLCGNYFARAYYDDSPLETGPDFFQRLQGDIDDDSEYGLETFLVGNWAKDDDSKIDWEYYGVSPKSGVPVRGMPSCLNKEICDDGDFPDVKLFIGRFRINEHNNDLLEAYGMEDILQE